MKNKKCKFKFFIILFLAILFLPGCNISENNEKNLEDNFVEASNDNIESCSLVFAGDILLHDDQLKACYDPNTKSYNFDEFFTNVKDYIDSADLAICNSETTFLGQGSSYSGYPAFNSPEEILSSLKKCGFNVLSSAHNHILDQGTKGFTNTVKTIKNNNFDLIGLKENDDDKNYLIKDVNNIKIGLTNYSYCGKSGENYTFNNIPLPSSLKNKINLFSMEDIDSYIENMKTTIDNMKKDGAEYIIFYIHWGNEYETSPNEKQKYLAQKLNALGVDTIIGSHPHVVQPIESIKNEASEKETLVCYSLGNFISNQRAETMGNEKSEDGLMIKLNIIKDENNNVILDSYESEPTWVNKYVDSYSKTHYEIIKIKDVLNGDNNEDYSAAVFNKIQNSYNSTNNIINN